MREQLLDGDSLSLRFVDVRPGSGALDVGAGTGALTGKSLAARAVLTEPLGAVTVVWIESGAQRLGVQVQGGAEPPGQADVQVLADPAHASVFDAETEEWL